MGNKKELVMISSEAVKTPFEFYYRQAMIAPVQRLPFFLPETMVNHKKMVHPPCTL
ncbi:MAG: hypothetical protein KF744_15810 [Taibaiella sp.]|nr:hypothetical protein [Taibaiella sp.]